MNWIKASSVVIGLTLSFSAMAVEKKTNQKTLKVKQNKLLVQGKLPSAGKAEGKAENPPPAKVQKTEEPESRALQVHSYGAIDLVKQNTKNHTMAHSKVPELFYFGIALGYDLHQDAEFNLDLDPLGVKDGQEAFIGTYNVHWRPRELGGMFVEYGRQVMPTHRVQTPNPSFEEGSTAHGIQFGLGNMSDRYEGIGIGFKNEKIANIHTGLFFAPGTNRVFGSTAQDEEWLYGFHFGISPVEELRLKTSISYDADRAIIGTPELNSKKRLPDFTGTFSVGFEGFENSFLGAGLYYRQKMAAYENKEEETIVSTTKEKSIMADWFLSGSVNATEEITAGIDLRGSVFKNAVAQEKAFEEFQIILGGRYQPTQTIFWAADVSYLSTSQDGKSVLTTSNGSEASNHIRSLVRMGFEF